MTLLPTAHPVRFDAGCGYCGEYSYLKFSFNNSQITSDFRYIVGAFYIIKNIRDSDLLPTSDILEDTERTVLYWKKYKKLLRFNHIIIKTKYFGKGGLESNDRLARHSTSAHILVDRHPNLLRLKDCRGYADAKCRRLKKIVSLE